MLYGKMRQRDSRGQSIVEFALVMPVLLVLVVGIIEWGFVMWAQASFADAARAGARSAAAMNDWNVNQSNDIASVKDTVTNDLLSLPGILKENIDTRIVVELLPDTTNIQSIRVSIVNQPYQPVLGVDLIPTPGSLSASAEYRYESSL